MIHSLVSNQHFLFWEIFIFILKINFSALLYKEAMALVKSPMVPPFSRVQVVQSILLGYLNTTGWIRWSPGRNAPFLKGRRLAPTLVVPSGKDNFTQLIFQQSYGQICCGMADAVHWKSIGPKTIWGIEGEFNLSLHD